jgi:probable F420-dependent oxidoreductase
MQIGVVFPQTEIGADPAVVRDFAQTAEGLGYSHLLVYDHVLGASIEHRPNWRGAYNSDNPFHEVFVLFGYLAGLTERLGLVLGVLVLPQRQTALVAKQAAEIDILSGGRLRLGVGVGWNAVEYEALGENFNNRGKRIEEQIRVLRELWTRPIVDFSGEWHRIPEAGINPLPVQQPIPIWMGGDADVVLQRAAQLSNGWFPQLPPDDRARGMVDKLREYAQQAGRDPNQIGIEARVGMRNGDPSTWPDYIEGWRQLGATHMGINTMGMGLKGKEHIEAIKRLKPDM